MSPVVKAYFDEKDKRVVDSGVQAATKREIISQLSGSVRVSYEIPQRRLIHTQIVELSPLSLAPQTGHVPPKDPNRVVSDSESHYTENSASISCLVFFVLFACSLFLIFMSPLYVLLDMHL